MLTEFMQFIFHANRLGLTPNWPLILRCIAAGPLTLFAALATMAAAPVILPSGAAGIDHLILPILLFPAFWAAYFFYALLERNPVRGFAVITVMILANVLVIYRQF